jgi:tetratricopeptide (TPR) repeat protein
VAQIHLAYGWYLMSIARFDEATREMERAQEIDPHSMVINRARGMLLYYMHQFDNAIEHLQRIANAEPGVALNHWALAKAYEQKGMYEEAIEENSKTISNASREKRLESARELVRNSGWQGYLQNEKELMLSNAAGAYISPMILAAVDAKLGNKEEAFAGLNKAIDERASGIPNLKVDPVFDGLHSDPRFAKLLTRMNIVP